MTKNKLKLGLVALVIISLSANIVLAADMTYSVDTNVYISNPGYTLVIKSGSVATSVIVDTTHIDIVVPISSTFTLASTNNVDVTGAGGAGATATNTCSGTTNTLVITTAAGATAAYTLTPNGGICSSSAGGGNYVPAPVPSTTPTPTPSPSVSPSPSASPEPSTSPEPSASPSPSPEPLNLVEIPVLPANPTTADIQAVITALVHNIAVLQAELLKQQGATTQPFNINLYYGHTNTAEVKRLQEFLISKGYLAVGLNTGRYYSLTVAAVKAYQTAKGITPVAGYFGPLTRAAVNADLGL